MDEPVVAFDLGRMLLGDDPPLFLAEILVRTLIIYGWTLLLLRWVGGRSIAQLSIIEFLLVIALGSAVGDALFYPRCRSFMPCWWWRRSWGSTSCSTRSSGASVR